MPNSASLKIDRASEHIEELNELLREQRPFSYVVETNANTGQRATFSKKNGTVVDRAALIAGDALHNLRSALDHAYWEIVSARVAGERERRAIQFPFSETAARLDEAVKNRLAHKVSQAFYRSILDLKPHGEPGGNELLYLLHEVDLVDKHKILPPIADYTRLSTEIVKRQVPDFPFNIDNVVFGEGLWRHCRWRVPPHTLNGANLGRIRPPTLDVFEKELDVPVDIVVAVGPSANRRPMVPTLYQLVDVTRGTIQTLRDAAR
jgi:hypothetical protein